MVESQSQRQQRDVDEQTTVKYCGGAKSREFNRYRILEKINSKIQNARAFQSSWLTLQLIPSTQTNSILHSVTMMHCYFHFRLTARMLISYRMHTRLFRQSSQSHFGSWFHFLSNEMMYKTIKCSLAQQARILCFALVSWSCDDLKPPANFIWIISKKIRNHWKQLDFLRSKWTFLSWSKLNKENNFDN